MKAPASVRLWQVAILVVFLLGWQFLPTLSPVTSVFHFLDPFYISSPTDVAAETFRLLTGSGEIDAIWGALFRTLATALVAVAASIVIGALAGLLFSESEYLSLVARPFVVLMNSVPRIAVIPIIVLVVGSSATADAVSAFGSAFFIVFFNAFEGGRSVSTEMIENVEIYGARRLRVMTDVRWPFVLVWTFAALPNAIAFGVIGSVTAELFTGSSGIGQLLVVATASENAELLISLVVILTVASLILVLSAERLRSRALHWWAPGAAA